MEVDLSFEKRLESLGKCLSCDFQQLHQVLEKGMGMQVQTDAAIYCTSTVESVCSYLLELTIAQMESVSPSNYRHSRDTKITPKFIQLALRLDEDFQHLIQSVESLPVMLDFFLNRQTAQLLCDKELMSSEEFQAKFEQEVDDPSDLEGGEGGATDEQALIQQHDKSQTEWQRRRDDPFSDADFATILKCVQPAFTLSHDGSVFLSALVRELLNATCEGIDLDNNSSDVITRQDVEAAVTSLFRGGKILSHIQAFGNECIDRFNLNTRERTTVALRFCYLSNPSAGTTKVTKQLLIKPRTGFQTIFDAICKKLRITSSNFTFVYRGHSLSSKHTPAHLSMRTGSCIFIVSKKWWNHRRRDEARRGMLTSNRPNENAVKQLKAHAQSRVKQLHLPTVGTGPAMARGENQAKARLDDDEIHLPPLSGRKSDVDPDSPAKPRLTKQNPRKPQGSPGPRPRGKPPSVGKSSDSPPKIKATFAAATAAKLQFLEQMQSRNQETMAALDRSMQTFRSFHEELSHINTAVVAAREELLSDDKHSDTSIGAQFKAFHETLSQRHKGVEKLSKATHHHSNVLLKLLRQWDKIENIRSPTKQQRQTDPEPPKVDNHKSSSSPSPVRLMKIEPGAAAAVGDDDAGSCNQIE